MNGLAKLIREQSRAAATERQVAVPVEVTGVNFDGEPTVTVRPMQRRRIVERNGEVQNLEPLEVFEVPYNFPSSGSFAVFVPPEIGMQGFLVSTDNEIGEIPARQVEVVRTNDKAGGFFIPSGNLSSGGFRGNPDWAELRSGNSRIAISDGQIHLQAGEHSLVLGDGANILGPNGFDLVAALKQISDHLGALEDLVHPGGLTHGGRKTRDVDDIPAPSAPVRTESGVR